MCVRPSSSGNPSRSTSTSLASPHECATTPTWSSRTIIAAPLHAADVEHAPRDLAPLHRVVGLVDLVQGVVARAEFVQLQAAAKLELAEAGHIDGEAGGAVVAALVRLPAEEGRGVQLHLGAKGPHADDHRR